MNIDRQFVIDHLLSGNGNLNPRALEKHGITKDKAYQVYHNMSGPTLCKECDTPTTFVSFRKGYTTFCSKSCMVNNADVIAAKKNTLFKNFGIDGFKSPEIQNKKKATSLANYGVDYPRQNHEYVVALQQKFLVEYGIKNPAATEKANKKRAETNLKKYGTKNPASTRAVRAKMAATNTEKYGVRTTLLLPENRISALATRRDRDTYAKLNDPEWLEKHKEIPSTTLAESLGIAWSTILNYYKKYNIIRPNIIVSSLELKLIDFLNKNNIQYINSERTLLDGKEIDIYLPEHKLGLEIDGLYWHSDEFIKDKFYHSNKSKLAQEKGIHLIHITDSELINQFEIVKSRILAKTGKQNRIFARKCKTVMIDSKTHNAFMASNHIQGIAPASVRIGLEHDGELVAVMSFSKARYNKNYEWELIRYATRGTIVGGATKLFSFFVSTFAPGSIISYADLRWNTGQVYAKLGMTLSHTSSPNYWYIVDGQLVHRIKFQKHKLRFLLAAYDSNLSEWENMKNNGYTRYWDCGNKVFVWNNSHEKN